MSEASPTRTNVSDITRRYFTDSVLDEMEQIKETVAGM